MKIQFESDLNYQNRAISSILNIFNSNYSEFAIIKGNNKWQK
jgi:hypothetical protein